MEKRQWELGQNKGGDKDARTEDSQEDEEGNEEKVKWICQF